MNPLKLLSCSLALSLCIGASAVPAKRGVRTFTQADGSTISLRLVGDEYSHTYITDDGMSVTRMPDGNFYYAGPAGISDVVAHNAADRLYAEKEFVKAGAASFSPEAVLKQRSRLRAKAARTQAADDRQVPCVGSPKVPVILVEYNDYRFKDSDPLATFNEFFRDGQKSASQYFADQSNGKFTPEFDVYGPFTLPGNRAVYGGNNSFMGITDIGLGKMVAEGCLGLDSQIDFSLYDNNGDGECDVVIVLYAGDGEASSYDPDCDNAVWPCQWELELSDYKKSLTLDGTVVNKFAVFNELNGSDLRRIDGIGTFCHEFSHCIDLPDFYDTVYGPHFGMADWSLMDNGCYNDDGYTPIGYSAYEKAFMGWIELEEGQEDTYYTLPVLNQKNAATDKAVRLTNAADPDEYYVIENRARQGWDKYMPAEGLLIYHVTYDADVWNENTVNDTDLQRMTPIPADGQLKLDSFSSYGRVYYEPNADDMLGDLWPYNGADQLTNDSKPAALVNTGGYMNKPVTEMTRNADGTISFWVMKAPLPSVAAPTGVSHKIESTSAVTISWTPGDDSEDVTYTVEIKQHKDLVQVSSTVFDSKNHGWTTAGYTNLEANGLRLGSASSTGSATSPAFTSGDDGDVTVMFNAMYYSGDESDLRISLVDNSGNTLDSKTVELTARDAAYSVLLQGKPESPTKVRFESTANKKRAYLSKADIWLGDATESGNLAPALDTDATHRIISGLTETSCYVDGLLENGIFDYRVKAVPADSENFNDSRWSDLAQFSLSGSNSISDIISAETPEYYSIQGLKLSGRPTLPGIYIELRGGKARKITVR